PLSKWIMRRYSKLWNTFKDKEFDHEQASKALDDDKMVSVILSDLKKAGWLEIRLHPDDSRKRIYKLKNPEDAVREIEM
ncbi:MAG: SAM-dependent DNA methyltransferase, partial [Candidatus Heimdallarchaeaceae archaeon]